MCENILLMFLSDIKIKATGEIQKTHYTNLDGEDTHATNESAVRYILQNDSEGAGISKIFIIASKAVRENIRGFSEEITHLEYFKNRMKKFLPNTENVFIVHEYDEDNKDNVSVENLKSVAEVARKIQNFAAKSDGEVILHTDLTGGMRHINMMMLDIIRLLEYSGVKIGKIIYSNFTNKKIEEVKNIYDLFQLISGVEEFINFGSVKVLKDYYKNQTEKISDALKNLLEKMENFAEAIKLCRYWQFKFAIKKLHDAINDFSADENNLNDVLMLRLIERIKQEYSMLIATRGQDDLKIIRWCVWKGYLQQALTLYTERVPEYIGEKKFYMIAPQEYKKLKEKTDKDKRSKSFYFLNVYLTQDDGEFGIALKNLQTDIDNRVKKFNTDFFEQIKKSVVPAIRNKNFAYEEWQKKIFENINLPVTWISPDEIFTDEKKLREQLELLSRLKENSAPLMTLSDSELDPIRSLLKELKDKFEAGEKGFSRLKKILEFIEKTKSETLKKFFPSFECKAQILRLQFMLEKQIFTLKVDRKLFLKIVDRYFRLKDERNHSNHANNNSNDIGEFETAADLEKCILDGLEEIEKITES